MSKDLNLDRIAIDIIDDTDNYPEPPAPRNHKKTFSTDKAFIVTHNKENISIKFNRSYYNESLWKLLDEIERDPLYIEPSVWKKLNIDPKEIYGEKLL
jgi:hypothetical protein